MIGATVSYYIGCDFEDCNACYEDNYSTLSRLKKDAIEDGWVEKDGKWYCEKHKEEL